MATATSQLTAFILCGGLGSRLRSVVEDRPKSMAKIGPRPFLEIQLRQLQLQGIERVILGTGYLSEHIEAYFRDGADFGLSIAYSRETEPLGTGGAMRLAAGRLSDPALILNGDSYCEIDFNALAEFYIKSGAEFAMVVRQVENANRYGRVKIDEQNRLVAFEEKSEAPAPGLINAGIYLCRRHLIESIPPGRPVSFERETIPAALTRPCRIFSTAGLFIDIGIPADYHRAQTLLADL